MTRARAALVAALLCGCAGGGAAAPAGGAASALKAGAGATDFTARDLDGRTVRLSDHLGKEVILLDFWATWCQPCQAEMPHLRKLYDAHKASGFLVIGVAMDGPDSSAEVPSFARRNGMTFPVVLDEDSRIASIYNPRKAAPLSVLIDRQGKVVSVREGYNPGDEEYVAREVGQVMEAAKAATSGASAPK